MSEYGLMTPQDMISGLTQLYNLKQATIRNAREDARWFVEQQELQQRGVELAEARKAWNEGAANREQARLMQGMLENEQRLQDMERMSTEARQDPLVQNMIKSAQQIRRGYAADINQIQARIMKVDKNSVRSLQESTKFVEKFSREIGMNPTEVQMVMATFPMTMMHKTGNTAMMKQLQYKPEDAVGDAAERYGWKADTKEPIQTDSEIIEPLQINANQKAIDKFKEMSKSELPLRQKKVIALAAAGDFINDTGNPDSIKTVALRNVAESFEGYLGSTRAKALSTWQTEYYKTVASSAANSTDDVFEMIQNMTPNQMDQFIQSQAGTLQAVNEIMAQVKPKALEQILDDVHAAAPRGADSTMPSTVEDIDLDATYKDNYAKFSGALLNGLRANIYRSGADASVEIHSTVLNDMERSMQKGTFANDYPQASHAFRNAYLYWLGGQQEAQRNYAEIWKGRKDAIIDAYDNGRALLVYGPESKTKPAMSFERTGTDLDFTVMSAISGPENARYTPPMAWGKEENIDSSGRRQYGIADLAPAINTAYGQSPTGGASYDIESGGGGGEFALLRDRAKYAAVKERKANPNSPSLSVMDRQAVLLEQVAKGSFVSWGDLLAQNQNAEMPKELSRALSKAGLLSNEMTEDERVVVMTNMQTASRLARELNNLNKQIEKNQDVPNQANQLKLQAYLKYRNLTQALGINYDVYRPNTTGQEYYQGYDPTMLQEM